MSEFGQGYNPEREQQEMLEWLRDQLQDYEDVFGLSNEELRGKKILEIGANDRRFAAAVIHSNLTHEVYSLEPALGGNDRPGYASQEFLTKVIDKLPATLQDEVRKRTVAATAEHIPFREKTIDLVLGRSVPFESPQELALRFEELLRVGHEVRLYPVEEKNENGVAEAISLLKEKLPVETELRTTLETDIESDEGNRHVVERVLVLRAKEADTKSQ